MPPDPFGDPRIAALYDQDNPPGADHAWFRTVADRIEAATIVDLGCGTGQLTVTLAGAGRRVVGVDPSEPMLARARHRPGAEAVDWLLGDARAIATEVADGTADLVLMSGNAAQHIVGDAWPMTLERIGAALRPGGTLGFESRNPSARAWESWTAERTLGSRDTPYGRLTEWLQVTRVTEDSSADGLFEVTFEAHNVFEATGERLMLENTLAFRSESRLAADLAAAGLEIVTVAGGWAGEPVDSDSPLLVVTARRV